MGGAEEKTTTLGAVLAGGAGSRLGGAKATAELAGRALIEHPLAALAAAGIEAVVVAKGDTELPALAVPVLTEPEQPRHPLLGIVTALRHGRGRTVLAVACDLPLVTPALLEELAASPESLTLAAPGGDPQPLLGCYSSALLPELESALAREEPMRRTVASLSPRLLAGDELARFGEPAELLLNVNDFSDLERARVMLASR